MPRLYPEAGRCCCTSTASRASSKTYSNIGYICDRSVPSRRLRNMDKNGFHLFADADPVKLTSGIDQLATQLSSTFGKVNAVLLTLGDTYGLAYFFHTVQALISALDFLQSLVPLLEETSITCFTSPFPPPRSAEVTLGKCVELFNSIVLSLCELGMSPEVCEKSNQTSPKGQTALRLRMILKAPRVAPALCDRMSRFEKATTLLHSIVMKCVSYCMWLQRTSS